MDKQKYVLIVDQSNIRLSKQLLFFKYMSEEIHVSLYICYHLRISIWTHKYYSGETFILLQWIIFETLH